MKRDLSYFFTLTRKMGMHIIKQNTTDLRACTGFDGGLEVGEAIRSGTLR